MLKTGRQSRKTMCKSPDVGDSKAGLDSLAEVKVVNDATLSASGALPPETKFAFQVGKGALIEYFFV